MLIDPAIGFEECVFHVPQVAIGLTQGLVDVGIGQAALAQHLTVELAVSADQHGSPLDQVLQASAPAGDRGNKHVEQDQGAGGQ